MGIAGIPPHTDAETRDGFINNHLVQTVGSDALYLGSVAVVELLRLFVYKSLLHYQAPASAWTHADVAARLMDTAFDYYVSDSYSDYASRLGLSNLDLVPAWHWLPRFTRRLISPLYVMRHRLTQLLWLLKGISPKPLRIYLHDQEQDQALDIFWIPASEAPEPVRKITNSSYFILAGKQPGSPCDFHRSSREPPIARLTHTLNCMSTSEMQIQVYLYPVQWQGENRVFVHLFYNKEPGALYLLPQRFGSSEQTILLNQVLDSGFALRKDCPAAETPNNSSSGYCATEEDYERHCPADLVISNPLHESVFDRVCTLIQSESGYDGAPFSSGHSPDEAVELSGTKSTLVTEVVSGNKMSLISAGASSFIVLDRGVIAGHQSIISLETRYKLSMKMQLSLDRFEAERPEAFSALWLSTIETLNIIAIQFLTGQLVGRLSSFSGEAGKPIHGEDIKNSIRQAPGGDNSQASSGSGSFSAPPDQPNTSSQGSRRTKKRPMRYRDYDDPPEPPEETSPLERYQPVLQTDPECISVLKQMKTDEGGSLATLSAKVQSSNKHKNKKVKAPAVSGEGSSRDFLQPPSVPSDYDIPIYFKHEDLDEDASGSMTHNNEPVILRRRQSLHMRAGNRESKYGLPCPVIGCNNAKGEHYRLTKYDYWWWHLKKHADGLEEIPFSSSHDYGESLLANQGSIQCTLCSHEAFSSFTRLGKHLWSAHYNELEQQKFNPYQLGRLLQITQALKMTAGDSTA